MTTTCDPEVQWIKNLTVYIVGLEVDKALRTYLSTLYCMLKEFFNGSLIQNLHINNSCFEIKNHSRTAVRSKRDNRIFILNIYNITRKRLISKGKRPSSMRAVR